MSLLDVAILLAFIAFAVGSGFRARRQASASLEEYFLAGRTLPGWKAGVSMAATQRSEFQAVVKSHGLDGLLEMLRLKVDKYSARGT